MRDGVMSAPAHYSSSWAAISPLPGVHARYRDRYSFELLRDRYQALPKEPLLVRAELLTPYVPATPDGSVHLDALLSAMVLETHPKAPLFPEDGSPACVPLPLELAWVSPGGRPLWVSSDLRPQGDAIRSQEYWHKRTPSDRLDLATKQRLETRRGRWKEYRMPLPTVRVPELRGVCIGNAPEIARLLSHVSHIGKKASQGFGRVSFRISRWDESRGEAYRACMHARPVPVSYIMDEEGELHVGEGVRYSRMGWTPPYWYAPWHDLAVIRD